MNCTEIFDLWLAQCLIQQTHISYGERKKKMFHLIVVQEFPNTFLPVSLCLHIVHFLFITFWFWFFTYFFFFARNFHCVSLHDARRHPKFNTLREYCSGSHSFFPCLSLCLMIVILILGEIILY